MNLKRLAAVALVALMGATAANASAVSVVCPDLSTDTREFTITTDPVSACQYSGDILKGSGVLTGTAGTDPLLTPASSTYLGAGYALAAKSDRPLDTQITLTGATTKAGTFSFALTTAPAGFVWTHLVLAMQAGMQADYTPDWASFLLPDGVTSGTWAISSLKGGLSHMNVYGQLAAVPLPASGLLLLGGIAAFAAMRRRNKFSV